MKIHLWLLVACMLMSVFASAQKVLQMEKRGKIKTKKFYLGEELTFKLKGQKEWLTDVMLDIKVEEGIIVFPERFVKVSDIKALKSYKNARRAVILQRTFYSFGASWLLFSLGGTIVGEPLNNLTWQVPVTSFVLGFLIKKIFYSRKYRIGKKRRLRVLDLSFNKNMQLGY
ncbi:MAG: hypothetical protein AAF573_01955 [Bacteroidota bacterium]